MPGTGARKYAHLSSWDQNSNNYLFEVDLKESSSERHFARDETQSPVILVRLCFPWAKLQHSDESHEATQNPDQAYSKPAVWKRILRKLRAEARKIQVACCEGLCWPREIPDYSSFSYHKNFDNGRQYWQQQSSTVQKPRSSSSRSYVSEFTVQVDPLWQRRKLVPPSKLQVKKVKFADI